MRFLLSIALVVGATGLLCHGVFKDEEAAAALKSAGRNEKALRDIQADWPYSEAAVQARTRLLDKWIEEKKSGETAPIFETAFARIHDGFGDRIPFINPHAATGIGLVALVLAVIMPRTRLRGSALILIFLGIAASSISFLEPGQQVGLVNDIDFMRHAQAQFPRVGAGLMFLAGLVMGPKSSPRERS